MKPILLGLVLVLGACSSKPSAPSPSGESQNGSYICPMECKRPGESVAYTQQGPGPCPVCGMALEPVSQDHR